jgi:glycosyltransferase involved in cell wall biosynthesis
VRVLLVSGEPVGGAMAGPAIRAFELARVLAAHCRVTLAAPAPSRLHDPRLGLLEATSADFERLLAAAREHDVVVAQQLPAQLLRSIRKAGVRYVADLYNPLMIELLEALAGPNAPPRAERLARHLTRTVFAQCAAADFVICASEKQRDLWIGGMGLSGLIDLSSYRRDRTYRTFVDVVPFGLRDRGPAHDRPVLKGVWPGIGADDQVLLWGGGVWRWLDALTPIRAVERLRAEGRPVHLFFLGLDPGAAPRAITSGAQEAIDYARQRDLDGRCVHFNRGWVPYEERESYLCEADIGISAHHDHLEARFSFRTRVLDYLWAALPMVLTRGDSMAELVEQRGLGVTVEPEDSEGFAAACAEFLDDTERRASAARRAQEVAPSFRWEEAARPLVDYCLNHRQRPVPRRHRAALAVATYGQYPGILANAIATESPPELARRLMRQLTRALRHGA